MTGADSRTATGAPEDDGSRHVRFADTDQQGVVYYGTYFEYLDEAAMDAWDRIGYGYDRRREAGWTTHIVHAEMDYAAPVSYGDELRDVARFDRIGETSFTMSYEAVDAASGERVASGEAVYATVDIETDESVPAPDDFRESIAAHDGNDLEMH
ncbi:MAG: acyl-CoA thioesterase [Halanaeroarchaeum sp.]